MLEAISLSIPPVVKKVDVMKTVFARHYNQNQQQLSNPTPGTTTPPAVEEWDEGQNLYCAVTGAVLEDSCVELRGVCKVCILPLKICANIVKH